MMHQQRKIIENSPKQIGPYETNKLCKTFWYVKTINKLINNNDIY